jgi:hypothetical protein
MSFKLLVHAWEAEVPTQSHRLVLMKLVDCCDDDGRNIFPKIANVAKAAKCSHRHVQRVVAEFCRIGLLRRVRDGGRGRDTASLYEMDLDMLARLRRAEMYPALIAAARFEPLGEDDGDENGPDEPESHAPDACTDGDDAPDSASSKGDRESPLEGPGVTWETAKGDKLSHPLRVTPQESLKDEREGARAQAGRPASEPAPDAGHAGHASDAGGAGQGDCEGTATPTLAEFIARYPHAGADDQIALASAWAGLGFADRRGAVDGIPGFLAERKAAGFTSRLSAPKYLAGRNWQHVPELAAKRALAAQGAAIQAVTGWSRDWWLMVLDKVLAGQQPSFWVQQAEAGKPMSATADDLAAAARRIGALQPFLCDGPEIEAWRPWLAARRVRIPLFSGAFRVFLPSPLPPGGRRDDGDDDVRF